LHGELNAVTSAQQIDAEFIFVDDGSSDGSWEVIRRLGAEDSRVRGIRFRRRFGKAAALNAGSAQRMAKPLLRSTRIYRTTRAKFPSCWKS